MQERGFFDMNDEVQLNERVQVVAIFDGSIHKCRPCRIRRPNGVEINVADVGLHYPIIRGRRIFHIFDVTDGLADYRLEFDSERLTWRLTREADRYE